MVGEEGYQKIAEASQSGSEIIFMMGLMNPDLYVKNQRVTNIRQVAAYDNSGGGTSTSSNRYCLSGEEHYEVYKEMFGAENVEWTSRDTLSSADRLRIQDWAYPPTDELYLKYKDVYQNDLYLIKRQVIFVGLLMMGLQSIQR